MALSIRIIRIILDVERKEGNREKGTSTYCPGLYVVYIGHGHTHGHIHDHAPAWA
jgi:hypothetical protein